jgi:UDP-N-acetylmuramoyl-L-alanyl-D-glutamate--2,6-diaminopimelate ligase
MAQLRDLLYKVSLLSTSGDMGVEVEHVTFDSREVRKGSLFVAVRGTQTDGHRFIPLAIENGAVAIVSEELPLEPVENIAYIAVPNSADALSRIAINFFGDPAGKLKLVGVTGTNGKTTVTTLLFNLFRQLGHSTGLLSTVVNKINDKEITASHTTPDAVSLNAMLAEMVDAGCTHCFMEVSSHALDQGRVAGIRFAGGIFTNITHDHLDYHKTFEEYITAKKRLFDDLPADAFALVNVDDKRGRIMLQNTKASKHTYALRSVAEFKGKLMTNSLQGLEMEIDGKEAWFRLIGDFNAYNLLAAYGCAVLLDEDSDDVITKLTITQGAPGRFEQVISKTKITAIVDYAHTPDALQNVLETIKEFRTGNEQVITVVGCGGDRDKGKRPLMASIACKYSDKVILTSDNPRTEDPMEIIRDMQAGVGPADFKKTLVLPEREEAIKSACMMGKPGDIILVAGKGHEKYQEIDGVKQPFDDIEVLERMLNLFTN